MGNTPRAPSRLRSLRRFGFARFVFSSVLTGAGFFWVIPRQLHAAALGALISLQFLRELPWTGYVFALEILVLVRPVALEIAFLRADLSRRERTTAYWFGPKGFASVVYGIMVLKSGMTDANLCFHLIAIVAAASMVAHSSTDRWVAGWFTRNDKT